MKHIKNAMVYSATLPAAEQLVQHLEERPYTPILPTQLASVSFVPVRVTNELVTDFEGGYCFSMRYDEKILPRSIVKAKAEERIKRIEDQSGKRMKKIERIAIHEDTLADLAKTALVKTAVITAYYNSREKLLIVPVTSAKLASIVVSTLISVVGSVKTTTIHISDIKQGLSTRLKAHLQEDSAAFEDAGFKVGEQVLLLKGTEKITYKLESLEHAGAAIVERLESGFSVNALSLSSNDVDFKLTHDFSFKQIAFPPSPEPEEGDDAVFLWRQDAAVQLLMLSKVIGSLCDMLGYKPPANDDAATAAA